MEICPHCHEKTFTSFHHFWFAKEGSVHACPSCGKKAGIPRSARLIIPAMSFTVAYLLAEVVDITLALVAVLPVGFAILVGVRGKFALVPVADDVERLPARPLYTQIVPALFTAGAIFAIAWGLQWTKYVMEFNIEDRIRQYPESASFVRPAFIPSVNWALAKKHPYSRANSGLPTRDREDTYLTLAVKENNLAAVQGMARPGEDLDKPNPGGFTPLHIALQTREFAIADALRAAGASLECPDKDAYCLPIKYAQSVFLDEYAYTREFAWLLEHGLDIHDEYIVKTIFETGGDMQKALLAWAGAPIPAGHEQEAEKLKQWILRAAQVWGYDEETAEEFVHHPFTVLQRESPLPE